MRRRTKTLMATAYHEAGHAVVAWHEGVRVQWATIIPGEGFSGRVKHANLFKGVNPEVDTSLRVRARVEKSARIAIAGRVAQQRACPGSRTGDGADAQHAFDVLSHLCGSTEETGAYWSLLTIQTRQTLARPDVWPIVKAVAAALLRQERDLALASPLAVVWFTRRRQIPLLPLPPPGESRTLTAKEYVEQLLNMNAPPQLQGRFMASTPSTVYVRALRTADYVVMNLLHEARHVRQHATGTFGKPLSDRRDDADAEAYVERTYPGIVPMIHQHVPPGLYRLGT